MVNCWLCSSLATTREHKIKKTTVEALMFRNQLSKEQVRIKGLASNAKAKVVQSSNSDYLKYQINLCAKCNGATTQIFDRAYETFFDYLIKNEKVIATKKYISIKDIHLKQEDLFKYFIKSFCCMFNSTNKLSVPEILIDALNGKSYGKNLLIYFCTNGQYKEYPLNKIIQVTNPILTPYIDNTYDFVYCESYGWLHIFYLFRNKFKSKIEQNKFKEIVPNYWIGKSKKIIINNL